MSYNVQEHPIVSADTTAATRDRRLSALRAPRLLHALAGQWRMVPVLVSLIIIWAFFWSQNPIFLSARNLSFLSVQIVVTALIGLGLFFVLVIGEIDLAIVANATVSAGVAGLLSVDVGWSAPLAIAAGLCIGAAIGLVQAVVVTWFRAPSFIVSLSVSLILAGALLQLIPNSGLIDLVNSPMTLITTTQLPTWLTWTLLGGAALFVGALRLQTHVARVRRGLRSSLLRQALLPVIASVAVGGIVASVLDSYHGVPTPVAILGVLLVIFWYVTRETRFGLHLYALGANSEAVRRSGATVNRLRITAFILAGMIAALAGIIAAGRTLGVDEQSNDPTLLLQAIAAAVIGGTSLFGGRGSIWSPLVGALVIGSISNGLLLLNASTATNLEVEGAILVVAVAVDAAVTRFGSPG